MSAGLRVGALLAVAAAVALVVLELREPPSRMTVPIASSRRIGPPCGPVPAGEDRKASEQRGLRLAVWRGRGVTEAEAQAQLELAASYWAPYGLPLSRLSMGHLEDETLIEGSRSAIESALREAHIDPTGPATPEQREAAQRVICAVALGPLRRFIEDDAERGLTNVVILRRIAEPGSAIAALLPDLRGLTFHPAMTSEALRACLDLSSDFPATVLIGLEGIAERRLDTVDVTLAHELGHTLGLEHGSSATADLMSTEPPRCVPTLTPAQREQIRPW